MRIKGTSISSLLAFLEEEYGAARTRDFIGSLDPALRRRCEGLVLASAFYPVAELESLATLARAHFAADHTFFERSGAFNASFGLAGVHQALLARRTPLDFLRAGERSWGQFIDTGSVTADPVADGKVRIRVEGLPGSEVRCPRLTGFLSRALELAGALQLSVRKVSCTLRGQPSCEWSAEWDAESSPKPISYTMSIRRPSAV